MNEVKDKSEVAFIDAMVYASKILYLEGHNDINNGQISFRDGQSIWIRRAFMGWEETGHDDFINIDLDGNRIAGEGIIPAEWPLHTETYRAREDVNCIIHSHPPYAMIFSATELELKAVTHDATPVIDTTRFTLTTNTVTNKGIAQEVAKALHKSNTMLLKNHGIVAAGKSIPETVCWAIALENACKLQLLAESTGVPYGSSEPHEVKMKKKIIFGTTALREYWAYWCRKVDYHFNQSRGTSL
ncbi:class II aldolase/adducin family protein [Paenibacillus sp. MMS18-CY102]|uniref:class II aldolase/adducin family protein n=1 Tax=Paenibacillus sp. MMS18-CY102 TaxID=2682849 RepID=UPI001366190E|nr:class II aldolase/adducin family protein [Paenibacillus sp. MMS18-CY102]MWC28981.1 class II aldolase/adducin family protein [Paenibacillus sp. MMS18-CY102]